MIIEIDDREAVELARRGDRRGMSALHQWYAPLLHRQAVSALRDPRAAEDAVRSAFLTAGERLDQLADPARVRGWLMAACARRALDVLPVRGPDDRPDPRRDAALADERLQILLDTARRLPPEDRVVVRLHLQGLRGGDLAAAMDGAWARAYERFHRARGRLGRAIGARLLGRCAPGACGDLEGLLDEWDGTFAARSRGTVVQHLDRCGECVERRMRLADPEEMLGVLALLGRSRSEEPDDDADIDVDIEDADADEDADLGVEYIAGGGKSGRRGASAPADHGRRWGGGPGGMVAVGGAAVVAVVAGGALLPQVWADDVDRSVAVSSAAGPAARPTPPPSSADVPSEAPIAAPTPPPTTDAAERPAPDPEPKPDREEPDRPGPVADGDRGTPATGARGERPTAAPAPPPVRPTTALDPLVGRWQDFGGFAMVVEEGGTGRLTAAPAGNGCGWAADDPLFRGITPTASGFTGERYLGPCVASPADWVPVTITVEDRRALTEATSFLGSLTWSAG